MYTGLRTDKTGRCLFNQKQQARLNSCLESGAGQCEKDTDI